MAMKFDAFHADPYMADDLVSSEDLTRWGTLATAALVVTYGLTRRSTPGMILAATAIPLAYRGFSGRWPAMGDVEALWGTNGRSTETELSGDKGIHVRESIRLENPIEEVSRFWRRLDNLPQFMSHLERVTELDHRRSHWVARGPLDMPVEWDAEIINEVENQVIGWRSLPGSDVVTAGSVNFDCVRSGRTTQVSLHLQYALPTGRLGASVAALFGREPGRMIREDLRRLKQLLEAGEVPRARADERSWAEVWR